MHRFALSIICSSLVLMSVGSEFAHADSFGVNIYGKSFHELPTWVSRDSINENNIGLGVRYSWGSKNGHHLFTEAGTFNDTFENQAKYISFGFQFRLFWQVRFGINTALYSTLSIYEGRIIIAPIPTLTIDFPGVTLNGMYLPPYQDMNLYRTFGLYLTLRIWENKK